MSNSLLISVADCDVRVALVEDGRLAEFYLESRLRHGPTGNIYQGRIVKLLPGMAAAFVNIGQERPAYLFAEDVKAPEDEFYSLWLKDEPGTAPSPKLPPAPIGDLLHEGQEILVQVMRGPLGTKGARLTTNLSLAGHYLVYTPTMPQLGISRRISDEAERQRLRTLLEELKPPEGGFIARTASRDQGIEKLRRERDLLLARWQQIPFPEEFLPALAAAGGTGDEAALRQLQFLQQGAQALALGFVGDAPGDPQLRQGGSKHQIMARQGEVGGEAGPFGPQRPA